MEERESNRIDLFGLLSRFFGALKRFWYVPLILAVLCGLYFYRQAKLSYYPMYEAKAIFTVQSGYAAEDIFGTSTYFDQYAAQQLAGSFPQVLNTDMMRELVVQNTENGYINGVAKAASVVDSNMMVLTVQSSAPRDALDYLQAIIKSYPQVAIYMVDYPQIKIVQEPTLPDAPYNSYNPTSPTVKGALLGLLAGLVLLFLVGMLEKTFNSTDELKSVTSLPILVSLPLVSRKIRRSKSEDETTLAADPNMEESLRGLRVKVQKHLTDEGKKTLLITSTTSGEGKTALAVNLARMMAKNGSRVLLVDGDLRKQTVARAMGQPDGEAGLIELLKNRNVTAEQIVCSAYDVDYISGVSITKQHYSLNARDLKGVLAQLAQAYDVVVIDAPPCDAVSDVTVLARCADCVLYVARQNRVNRDQMLNALTAMHQKGVTIHGVVFNGATQNRRGYGYGHSYGYGYGYDYRYGYGYSKYGNGYSKYGNGYGKYAKERKKNDSK